MAKYLAVDSGGTKVMAIMYDDTFMPIAVGRVGSMRNNTTSEEMIENNINSLMDQLGCKPGDEFELVSGVVAGEFYSALQKKCKVNCSKGWGEDTIGYAAAELFGDAMLALSGTGCTMFSRYKGEIGYLGGYGAAVSDEGSGYWMSRHALDAAIKSYEGRGPKTILEDLVTEYFEKENLTAAIFSIYSLKDRSPTSAVASCAPLVDKAAYAGDEIAMNILKMTGFAIGQQLEALARIKNIPEEIPVTISGSVWRAHPLLFSEFEKTVHQTSPNRKIVVPDFEPIIGTIIQHYYELHGSFDSEIKNKFKEAYAKHTFKINK